MTVAEAIEYLSDFDGDKELFFAHPSHDHWGTELATPVELIEVGYIKHSTYHNQDQVIKDENDYPEDEDDNVILMS